MAFINMAHTVHPRQYNMLTNLAKERGMTRSAMLRDMIDRWIRWELLLADDTLEEQ